MAEHKILDLEDNVLRWRTKSKLWFDSLYYWHTNLEILRAVAVYGEL